MWFDGEHLKLATLPNATGVIQIGRAQGSSVDLSDRAKYDRFKAVSRRHAQVREIGGAFFLEHLSTVNPTMVNGVSLTSGQPYRLSDQDLIDVGGLRLTFHDLAAADRISGVVCPSCGRENDPTRQDCWYDGTNLVSAVTEPRRMRRAYCRAASDTGEVFDLYPTDALVVDAGGRCDRQPVAHSGARRGVAVVALQGNRPVVQPISDAKVDLNGSALTETRTLNDGDELAVGARFLAFILR
jgi:hypothetical protein